MTLLRTHRLPVSKKQAMWRTNLFCRVIQNLQSQLRERGVEPPVVSPLSCRMRSSGGVHRPNWSRSSTGHSQFSSRTMILVSASSLSMFTPRGNFHLYLQASVPDCHFLTSSFYQLFRWFIHDFRYTQSSLFSPGSYDELLRLLEDLVSDHLPTSVILTGDFNAHIFDDVSRSTPYDLAFRRLDTDLRCDGFLRLPQVPSHFCGVIPLYVVCHSFRGFIM